MTFNPPPGIPLGSGELNQWRVSDSAVDLIRPHGAESPVTFPAQPQELRVDLRRTALIVIDMQNDFCTPGGWLHHIGVDVTPTRAPVIPLNRLMPELRAAGTRIVWVNWGNRPDRLNLSPSVLHVYKPTGQGVGLGDPAPLTGAPVLEKESWGAAIIDDLHPAPEDIHVDKFRMSGFWDSPLDSILRNLGVTTLLFAGVNVDQCLLCTLQDANFLGYDCVLVEDCAATTSPQFCTDATIYNVKQCFGFIARAPDIIDGLRNAAAPA
ncbi:MAG: isochorismatase family protein [Rhodospirillales bacterium]|nr:isochorismatase family protein [Rhodospirillales bacterium]